MAQILNGFVRLYYYLNEDIADHRTENWFLMRTPWPGAAFLILYLLLVFRWLPQHMRTRKPYDLKILLAVYNALQVALCIYVVYYSLTLGWLRHYSLICQPVEDGSPHGVEYAFKVCYMYFLIKIIDLWDTIFFVMRKKQNQVSFLHVYHHTGMVMLAWGIVKWVPGGHVSMLALVNSAVHVVMYSYYFMAALKNTQTLSKWKKRITQLQIGQFMFMLYHYIALVLARDCDFPKQPAYIMIPQTLFMIGLFLDFYCRSYILNNKTKS